MRATRRPAARGPEIPVENVNRTPTSTPTPEPGEYNATQEFLDNLDDAGIEVTHFVDEHEDLDDGE